MFVFLTTENPAHKYYDDVRENVQTKWNKQLYSDAMITQARLCALSCSRAFTIFYSMHTKRLIFNSNSLVRYEQNLVKTYVSRFSIYLDHCNNKTGEEF